LAFLHCISQKVLVNVTSASVASLLLTVRFPLQEPSKSNVKVQKAKSIALIESPIATVEKDLCQKKGAP